MAIDHGLGGKDNTKSKDKRAKRALKNKKTALKAITGGKKREVIFDAAAREDFLTGFRKRKQERRKYGIAMDVSSPSRTLFSVMPVEIFINSIFFLHPQIITDVEKR